MERHGLSDEQWGRVWPVLPGKVGDRGRSAADNRRFLDAVLWIAGTGAPWRDLPEHFGNWNSNFRRFRRWAVNGVFDMLFERLSGDRDFEYAMIDGTIVRVHQQGTGARGGTHRQAIGRSRGGLTTKIVALVDALGNLARFILLPGQTHDLIGVKPLIQDVEFDMFLGDKAFDADWLRAELNERGAVVVIPPKSNRKQKIDCDFHAYRWRHLVENFFCSLKTFRRIATRYDKTDESYRAMINLAALKIAMR
ncbi:MAG: IS5 family transposase [Parvibaculaceae bacterium]|nr:IS5 family transposase [Parvibaculaceae bacterium]